MKTLMPMIASLLPLVASLVMMVGAGRARGGNPPTTPPRPEVEPVELPADPAIRCPLDRGDAPLKKEGQIASLAYSPDGRTLAAGNASLFVKLFDPHTGRSITSFEPGGGSAAIAFSPDGMALAAQAGVGVMAIFDPASGGVFRKMDPTAGAGVSGLGCSAFSPDGKILAAGFVNGEVALWDAATGRLLHVLPPHVILPRRTAGPPEHYPLKEVVGVVGFLAFSPDGSTLYGGGHVARAWDVTSGSERARPEQAANAAIYAIAVSPDGKTLAGGERYQQMPWPAAGPFDPRDRVESITLWDAATGRKRAQLPTTEPITGLAFLPGGKTLVTLEGGRVVRLWDIDSGHSTAAVRFEHHFRCPVLAVSPDGKQIAAGGYESDPIFGAIVLMQTDGVKLSPWKPKP